ncbi:glutaredoxin family protein [Microbacterium sp. CPCC 204701]|uniref:glutaredoxin family protein n=1 Tax=Microbacterium sp. CPCC 204701 TaxID=2493084 RepID=UPI000FDBFA91|nr:glutaredoxin family protein [Microbacterium sp. CPCC 204701]
MITVYTTGSACVQCTMTKRVLDAAGIPHSDVDLADPANSAAREYVTDDLGYSRAPVVVIDDHHHWSGFQPLKIKELAERIASAR